MIFKKWAIQLFTWLSCNSTRLFEKKIWKLVLGCLRAFHSACNKSQDVRQLQLHIFTTGDNWSSTQTPDSKTWDKWLWTGNSRWAVSSPTHSDAFLQDQCILGHQVLLAGNPLQDRWTSYALVFWVCWLIWIPNPLDFGMIILSFTWESGWGQGMHQATGTN